MPSSKIEPFFIKSISKQKKSKLIKKISLLVVALLLIGVVIGIVLIFLYAIVPCKIMIKPCNANATCINQLFFAKCKCNSGFQGNGIDCDECGLSYPNPAYNIAGYNASTARAYSKAGAIATPFSYPSTVDMFFSWHGIIYTSNKSVRYYYDYSFECGGTLINRRTILTAASCFPQNFSFSLSGYNNDTLTYPIQFDSHFPNYNGLYHVYVKLYLYYFAPNQYNDWPTEKVPIQDVIIHDGWTQSSLDNDIALIRLKNPITLDLYGQIACVPEPSDIRKESSYLAYNKSVTAVGWEYYYGGAGYVLAEFHQNIVYPWDCFDLFTSSSDYQQLICTRDYLFTLSHMSSSLAYLCNGLTGGGLFTTKQINGVNKTFLIGIAINDTECGINMHTNLFNHIDWINDNSYY